MLIILCINKTERETGDMDILLDFCILNSFSIELLTEIALVLLGKELKKKQSNGALEY